MTLTVEPHQEAQRQPRPTSVLRRGAGRWWLTRGHLHMAYLILAAMSGTGVVYRLGFQSPGWMALYALTILWYLRDWRQSAAILWQAWPVLMPCVIAMASTLWSVNPPVTAYRSFQLTMTTLIAVRIASAIPAHHTMIVVSLTSAAKRGAVLSEFHRDISVACVSSQWSVEGHLYA
ncbi:hypothetical protein L0Z66_19480 (plasmid) [Phaeobacter sp. BS34]|uniref:hypothetical protein n=1 Tax=Phaeobacter sp. BS34 TaxID=2907240 RepID=UPI00370412F3